MIISASRRTDIPAFYSDWFINRLREGYVIVPQPRKAMVYSKISLNPDIVDCIVFWSKDPENIIDKLDEISKLGYKYYFQFSLTPYGRDMEENLKDLGKLIKSFIKLSEKIGEDKIIWRYDPIILSDKMDISYHFENFEKLAKVLHTYTKRCIYSYLDLYPKVRSYMFEDNIIDFNRDSMVEIAKGFSQIARSYKLELMTCGEEIDLDQYNIKKTSCIDQDLIESIIGYKIECKLDKSRPYCKCIECVDIGTYDTCLNGCRYCYGKNSDQAIVNNFKSHNKNSPLLVGKLPPGAQLIERERKSLKKRQLSFL